MEIRPRPDDGERRAIEAAVSLRPRPGLSAAALYGSAWRAAALEESAGPRRRPVPRWPGPAAP